MIGTATVFINQLLTGSISPRETDAKFFDRSIRPAHTHRLWQVSVHRKVQLVLRLQATIFANGGRHFAVTASFDVVTIAAQRPVWRYRRRLESGSAKGELSAEHDSL